MSKKKTIGLIAGHHRAFYYHWRDTGALPTWKVKNAIDCKYSLKEPIYNEHHEMEKLADGVKGGYYGEHEILVCPFYYNLYQKKKWAELYDVDWIISLHMNSTKYRDPRATGFEMWVYYPDVAARIEAQNACKIASGVLGLKNKGVKYSDEFYILKTDAQELLCEMGFICNPDDVIAVRERGVEAVLGVIDSL